MAKQTIFIGTQGNDGTGDDLRTAFRKVNENFDELYTAVGGADLAEYYESEVEYEPGTVVVFGGNKDITTTDRVNDTRVAGVITNNPAYIMNVNCPSPRSCVALIGRVPCKVVGRFKKGDLVTTSATLGHGVKALNPMFGSIIGKALENKESGEAGIIEIAVGKI